MVLVKKRKKEISGDIPDVFLDFLTFLAVERGFSSNTISSYRRDLIRFNLFCESNGLSVSEVSPSDIEIYVSLLRSGKNETLNLSQALSEASIARNVVTLRTFFSYFTGESSASSNGKVVVNPLKEISTPKIGLRLPKAVDYETIVKVLDSAMIESNPHRFRDRAVMELLYSTGARTSEVAGVNLDDIILSEDEVSLITLRGKGNKERIVPVGRACVFAIQEYLVKERNSIQPTRQDARALFVSRRGNRISRQVIDVIIKDACVVASIKPPLSAHTFRHSYATHLLDGGADIRSVQELLGHASVATTQIYTAITIDKIRESYRLAHPRA
jgi:integrase/recombinase XerD